MDLLAPRALRCFEVAGACCPPCGARMLPHCRKRLPRSPAAPRGGAVRRVISYRILVAAGCSQWRGSGIQPSGCHRARSHPPTPPPERCVLGLSETLLQDGRHAGNLIGRVLFLRVRIGVACPLGHKTSLRAAEASCPRVSMRFFLPLRPCAGQTAGRFGAWAAQRLAARHAGHETSSGGGSWADETG